MSRRTKPAMLTWPDALDLFVTHLAAKRSSPRTVVEYHRELEHLRDLLASPSPADVTLDDLRDLQVRLLSGDAAGKGRPLAPGTVAKVTTVWRVFFRFLTEESRITADPTLRLEHPKVPHRLPGEVLTVAEVERILTAHEPTPQGFRDSAVLDVLFSTGLRSAEVQALDLGDLDHEHREVVVRCGKGEKARIVPLARSAYARLRAYLDDARTGLVGEHPDGRLALFLTNRGRRVHHEFMRLLVNRACVAAGLKKHFTPQSFRRTFATTLLRNGVSVRHIQVLLGHARLDTTARAYLRVDRAELRRELLLKHPRERFDA